MYKHQQRKLSASTKGSFFVKFALILLVMIYCSIAFSRPTGAWYAYMISNKGNTFSTGPQRQNQALGSHMFSSVSSLMISKG